MSTDHYNEPSRNIVGRFLRSAPIASYAIAQFVVVGYWAYRVSEYGVDLNPDFDPDLFGAFLDGHTGSARRYSPRHVRRRCTALGLPAIEGARRAADRPLRAGMDRHYPMGLAIG